jgi:hypothetical protein
MRLLIPLLILIVSGCCTYHNDKQSNMDKQQDVVLQFTPGPPTLVYKTKADYNNLVPVILSDDKTKIVSYPHPSDVKTESGFLLPVLLNGGYLLDTKGIGKNVAFLKMTYEEYSKLGNTPPLVELYNQIIDKDPLTELCDCGNKKAFTDIINQLNYLIDNKKLRSVCKVVK